MVGSTRLRASGGTVLIPELHRLSRICTASQPSVDDITAACALIRDALGASDAYVIRSGDPDFIRLGCPCNPADYEIKQKGYWLVWRDLAAAPNLPLGTFTVQDRIVTQGGIIEPGKPVTHIGAILPGDESNSEILIIHGP